MDIDNPTSWDRLFRGGLWAILGRFSAVILSGLLSFLLARLLSPSELGVFFLILSLVSAASTFGLFGLHQSSVQLISSTVGQGNHSISRKIVQRVLRIAIVSAILVALALLVGLGNWLAETVFRSKSMADLVPWIAGITFLMVLQQLLSQIHRGYHDIREAVIFGGLLTNGIVVITLGLALVAGVSIELSVALALMTGALIFSVVFAVLFLFLRLKSYPPRMGGPGYRKILARSTPLFISTVTFLLINNFDLWIVGSYLPESDVAIYGAAIRLVLFISTPLLIINSVVPPIIGELYARGSQATLQRLLQASAAAAVLPAVTVFLIYLLAPEWSLGIAFGAAYRTQSAVSVLLVLGAGKLISVYFGSCGNTLIMTGHERLMMKIAILGGAFTVIAGLALIETFGILGAAIASSSGLIFQNIMMWIGANRKTGIKTHASFLLLPEFIHAAKQSLGSKEK